MAVRDVKIKRTCDVLEEELAPIRRRREELAKIQKRLWKCCIKEVLLLKSGSTNLNRSQKQWEFNISKQ